MLQSTEYQVGPYLKWFWHTTHFERVRYRRTLNRTKAARLLLLALWHAGHLAGGLAFGLAVLIINPVLWAHLIAVPLEIGRLLVVRPRQWRLVRASRTRFAGFAGAKIAIAGSYGKTSMKELLLT